jgi:hypothetical protein
VGACIGGHYNSIGKQLQSAIRGTTVGVLDERELSLGFAEAGTLFLHLSAFKVGRICSWRINSGLAQSRVRPWTFACRSINAEMNGETTIHSTHSEAVAHLVRVPLRPSRSLTAMTWSCPRRSQACRISPALLFQPGISDLERLDLRR